MHIWSANTEICYGTSFFLAKHLKKKKRKLPFLEDREKKLFTLSRRYIKTKIRKREETLLNLGVAINLNIGSKNVEYSVDRARCNCNNEVM